MQRAAEVVDIRIATQIHGMNWVNLFEPTGLSHHETADMRLMHHSDAATK
jgi:hypothetical protein